jgi:hypothetical protein
MALDYTFMCKKAKAMAFLISFHRNRFLYLHVSKLHTVVAALDLLI